MWDGYHSYKHYFLTPATQQEERYEQGLERPWFLIFKELMPHKNLLAPNSTATGEVRKVCLPLRGRGLWSARVNHETFLGEASKEVGLLLERERDNVTWKCTYTDCHIPLSLSSVLTARWVFSKPSVYKSMNGPDYKGMRISLGIFLYNNSSYFPY